MDSNAYKYLIAELIHNTPELSKSLPFKFTIPNISLSRESFKAVAYFLAQLVLETENNEGRYSDLSRPFILIKNDSSFFVNLFRHVHLVFLISKITCCILHTYYFFTVFPVPSTKFILLSLVSTLILSVGKFINFKWLASVEL